MSGIHQALFMSQPAAVSSSISFIGVGTMSSDWGAASLPITGAAVGDTVFIWVISARSEYSGSVSDVYIAGYTKVGTRTDRIGIASLWCKRLTAADTSVTVAGAYDCSWSAMSYVMRGVAATPVGGVAWYNGSSIYAQADPPAITPTAAGSAVLALGSLASYSYSGAFSSGPAGFNNVNLFAPAMSTPICRVGMSWKPWTSGVVDPSAYVYNTSSAGDSIIAASVVLLPE